MVVNVAPSATVWFGISVTTGASLTAVTVNVAGSESVSEPKSVAVNVIVSLPFQSTSSGVIVAILPPSIEILRLTSPV